MSLTRRWEAQSHKRCEAAPVPGLPGGRAVTHPGVSLMLRSLFRAARLDGFPDTSRLAIHTYCMTE